MKTLVNTNFHWTKIRVKHDNFEEKEESWQISAGPFEGPSFGTNVEEGFWDGEGRGFSGGGRAASAGVREGGWHGAGWN